MNNWSTPSAHDGRRPGSDDTSTQGRNLKREAEAYLAHAEHAIGGGNLMSTPNHTGGIDLEGAAELWGTPTSRDHKDGATTLENTEVNGLLGRQVLVCSRPDQPTESSGQQSSESAPTSRRQSVRRQWASSLSDESLRRLAALQRDAVPDGSERKSVEYSLCLELAEKSTKKRLNVSFVEKLQGLPGGWTSPEPINSEALETWSYLSKGHLRCLFYSKDRNDRR